MDYAIRLVEDGFAMNALSVAKIVEYPFEKRDFMPYAQARVCICDQKTLIVRMWAFEVSPKADVTVPSPDLVAEDSLLCFQLSLGKAILSVSVNAVGVLYPELVDGDTHTPLDPALFEKSPFTGEDLQGAYWGMQFSLPLQTLADLLGGDPLTAPVVGNLYKACFHPSCAHIGGLFKPLKNTLYDREALRPLAITAY